MKKKKQQKQKPLEKTFKSKEDAIKKAQEMFGDQWRSFVSITYEPNAYGEPKQN